MESMLSWSYIVSMFSVVGNHFSESDFYQIDLSQTNKELIGIESTHDLWEFIQKNVERAGKILAYGGYGEQRNLYKDSPLFNGNERTLHLGIDVWLPPGTPVFAAKPATIFAKAYNDKYLDYGYTVILKHSLHDREIFSLYGHLGALNFDVQQPGQLVAEGDIVGYIGKESENGGWAPHLHFQLIHNLEGNVSDYPGVCATANSAHYLQNCPDPTDWIIPK